MNFLFNSFMKIAIECQKCVVYALSPFCIFIVQQVFATTSDALKYATTVYCSVIIQLFDKCCKFMFLLHHVSSVNLAFFM